MKYWVLMLAQDATPTKAEIESKSILQYVQEGGPLSYVLVFLSFVALALMIRNFIIFSRKRLSPPGVMERLSAMLRENDVEGALAYCAAPENNSFLARVFGAALLRCSRSAFGFLELRSALEEAGSREADKLHRSNEGLGILAAIGPMLGLLGTVIGMIGAFQTIGTLEGAARSQQLAVFMAYALVNTAEGLVVAIPCTVAFALFRRHVDHLIGDIATDIEELARHLEHTADTEKAPHKPAAPASGQRGAAPGRGEARGVHAT
jgi:biopolymer transport protein ExbB